MYEQVNIDRTSEKISQTLRQDQGNTRPKKVFTPQPPTFIRGEIDYSKSYHPVQIQERNIDGNFEDIDLSEHISKRLREMAWLERRPENGREGSCSESSDYAASTLLLIEYRYPNQTQHIDQFIYKK